MRFTRKYLSAAGLHKTVKHSLLREQFKVIKNSEYNWQDCIMSGLAVFGFKMPSLLQFEKDKASEPWIWRNLRTLYGVEQAPSDTCMRERLDIVSPRQLRQPFKKIFAYLQQCLWGHACWPCSMQNRERNVQYTQKSGLQFSAQLWPWLSKLMLGNDYASDWYRCLGKLASLVYFYWWPKL